MDHFQDAPRNLVELPPIHHVGDLHRETQASGAHPDHNPQAEDPACYRVEAASASAEQTETTMSRVGWPRRAVRDSDCLLDHEIRTERDAGDLAGNLQLTQLRPGVGVVPTYGKPRGCSRAFRRKSTPAPATARSHRRAAPIHDLHRFTPPARRPEACWSRPRDRFRR